MSSEDLSQGEGDDEVIDTHDSSETAVNRRKKLWNSFKRRAKPKKWGSKDKNKGNGADPRLTLSQPEINDAAESNGLDSPDKDFDSLFEAAQKRRDEQIGFSDSDLPSLRNKTDTEAKNESSRPQSLSLDNATASPSTSPPVSPTNTQAPEGKVNLQQYPFFLLEVILREGKDLAVRDKSGTSDPYVKFKIGNKQLYKSRIIYKNLNPRWDESFTIPVESINDALSIKVYDYDRGASDDSMGSVSVDLTKLPANKLKNMKLKLTEGSKHEKLGHIVIDFKLIPKTQEEKEAYLARKGGMSGGKKLKTQSWSGVVTITLLEGKNLIAMDEAGTSDPYVKFRLGNQKYKSKTIARTTNPKWREQFDLYWFEDQSSVLEVAVFDHDVGSKDDLMGRCTVDLNALAKEKTHTIDAELEDDAGFVHFLLTISGTAGSETVSDLATFKLDPQARRAIVEKYGLKNSLKGIKGWDVGWLQIKVIKAQGLTSADIGGKSDPLCVLELVNARLQTQTIYKTLNPEWGKVFTFNVKDIHEVLEVTVYDEDRNKSLEFLGKVAIPLLRIRNGERRWYTLKDKKLRGRAKGAIVLEMDLIYNPVKAAIRTFNPREPKYIPDSQKFSRKILMRNINRIKKLALNAVEAGKMMRSCFDWENKARSACAFAGFIVGVLMFELYMAPLGLLVLFMKNYVVYSVVGGLMKASDDDPYEDSDDDEDDEPEPDKKSKQPEEKKSFKEKLQQIQEVCLQVQNGLGDAAAMGERVNNTFNYTVPWLSWLLIIVLCIVTVVLYNIPLRYLILAWGCNKFTKKLRNPHYIDNNELADFLSRVPSDDELAMYRELRPDIPASVLAAKKKKVS
ncbi:multiple C2 and transmembrane domain-containing protein 1-like isoform X2 [Ptychodera flava]|uniref:multiple C2 and transmembrane domain-containing protein 1-like isoform X2 n=1 Tax=Ptychodera flava TaxID=63121 RepID=UPI003969E46C